MKTTLHFLLLVFCTYNINGKEPLIPPHQENIHFIGRSIQHKDKITFAYSGSQIRFSFTGKAFSIVLEDLGLDGIEHQNFFTININGTDSTFALNTYKKKYYFHAPKDTNHVIIHKNTEASVGTVNFYGIILPPTAVLVETTIPKRKLLWIGDSYTAAYGNKVNIAPPPAGNPNTGFHSINQDNYQSWSSLTDRNLNAISRQICYSGEGVYRNFAGDSSCSIPKIYPEVIPKSSYTDTIKKNEYHPDLIIICLGTNDFGPELADRNKLCDSLIFTKAFLNFIQKIRYYHGDSPILLVTSSGLSDFWPASLRRKSRLSNYLKSIAKQSGLNNIYHFDLSTQTPPYGEDWHPSIKTHQKMSTEITGEIKRIMNWD